MAGATADAGAARWGRLWLLQPPARCGASGYPALTPGTAAGGGCGGPVSAWWNTCRAPVPGRGAGGRRSWRRGPCSKSIGDERTRICQVFMAECGRLCYGCLCADVLDTAPPRWRHHTAWPWEATPTGRRTCRRPELRMGACILCATLWMRTRLTPWPPCPSSQQQAVCGRRQRRNDRGCARHSLCDHPVCEPRAVAHPRCDLRPPVPAARNAAGPLFAIRHAAGLRCAHGPVHRPQPRLRLCAVRQRRDGGRGVRR